ncbi:MAG TPA: efflux RND transporter permease subunit, partial [Oligoflexia bacterium]|nr:efflux RND transporter permease subunit [Oligoflexia bacterium]
VIAVAFMPIFALEDQEGRLFKPLAYTKNLTMAIAAILAVTLDPAVRMLFARVDFFSFRPRIVSWLAKRVLVGTYYPEEQHPISRALFWVYERPCRFVIRYRKCTIAAALLVMLSAVPVYQRLGTEFMPPLWEGDLLYMPTTLPGISVTEAQKLMQSMDQVLRGVPEVERVFGKSGRAESSTDPAPFSMMETTIMLKPRAEWRTKARFYSEWPEIVQKPLRWALPDRLSKEELVEDLNRRMQFPGVTNAWTMPIKARIDMLSTGVRTPIGIKVFGADVRKIEEIGAAIERILKDLPGTRSVYAERTAGGYFLDFELKRENLARYGISIEEAQMVIMSAVGGENVTTTIEGRERYPVNVRYARELRDDLSELGRVLVPAMSGAQVPLAEIAELRIV